MMMMKSRLKYYLCTRGKVKAEAEKHRAAFIRLRNELFDVVHAVGAPTCKIDDTMMLLIGILFDGAPPDGWTKKNKHGYSRPKKVEANKEILKKFTPSGGYCIEPHKDIALFMQWLGCPASYQWDKPNGSSGFNRLGRMFSDGYVYWYTIDGPIMLELPDVAYARAAAIEAGEIVKGNVLDWQPPSGLKEIMLEEWKLMGAKQARIDEQTLAAGRLSALVPPNAEPSPAAAGDKSP